MLFGVKPSSSAEDGIHSIALAVLFSWAYAEQDNVEIRQECLGNVLLFAFERKKFAYSVAPR